MKITAHDTFHGRQVENRGAPVFDDGPPPGRLGVLRRGVTGEIGRQENVRIYERDPEDEGKWECGICGSLHWAPNMPATAQTLH